MNERIENILDRARDTLNDPKKERWSDEALLRLMQDCILDISVHTKFFTKRTQVFLEKGQIIYQLPDDVYQLKAFVYNGQEVPVVATGNMDNQYGSNWRVHSAQTNISKIVKENLNSTEFQVYPRPYLDSIDQHFLFTSSFGFDLSVNGFETTGLTDDSLYGIVGTIADSDYVDYIEPYGILAGIATSTTIEVIYSSYRPGPATVFDEPPVIPIFDKAIKHYICSQALRNDMSESNRTVGSEEWQFYQREISSIQPIVPLNNSPTKHQYNSYQGMG